MVFPEVKFTIFIKSIFFVCLLLGLYSCGGGGGSGGGSSNTSDPNIDTRDPNITFSSITIPTDTVSIEDIALTFTGVSGTFTYESDGEIYAFFSGEAAWVSGQNNDTFDFDPVPSQIIKKVNGEWVSHKTDNNAAFWGIRNFEQIDDYIFLGDGNEIGAHGSLWKGHAWKGQILSNGDIDWLQINDITEMGFFHGIGAGDINNDGLIDVGLTPGISHSGINIFMQNLDGSFTKNDAILNFSGSIPFTLDFANVTGDERDEIITADYGGGTIPPDLDDHEIRIYKYDDATTKFELFYQNNEPNIYSMGLGATSIKVHDFNNDGIMDISVAREDAAAWGFEVWKGKNDGSYEVSFSSPAWNADELSFREFFVFDANNDGFLDIVLRPFGFGELLWNDPCDWNIEDCGGIKLNHLIWLNNGDATFSYYNEEELSYPGVLNISMFPYKDGDDLHFVGANWFFVDKPIIDITDVKVSFSN